MFYCKQYQTNQHGKIKVIYQYVLLQTISNKPTWKDKGNIPICSIANNIKTNQHGKIKVIYQYVLLQTISNKPTWKDKGNIPICSIANNIKQTNMEG